MRWIPSLSEKSQRCTGAMWWEGDGQCWRMQRQRHVSGETSSKLCVGDASLNSRVGECVVKVVWLAGDNHKVLRRVRAWYEGETAADSIAIEIIGERKRGECIGAGRWEGAGFVKSAGVLCCQDVSRQAPDRMSGRLMTGADMQVETSCQQRAQYEIANARRDGIRYFRHLQLENFLQIKSFHESEVGYYAAHQAQRTKQHHYEESAILPSSLHEAAKQRHAQGRGRAKRLPP